MTLSQALAVVARYRRPLLALTQGRPMPEQQSVSDGPIGIGYRAAVEKAQQLYRDEEDRAQRQGQRSESRSASESGVRW